MNSEDLLKVAKPSRYLGGELHSVIKNPQRVKLTFALAFPDVYEVGMSHLGFQILYSLLNEIPEIACERVFAPWPDMENLLREQGLPLCSLESSRPLKEFSLLGFSLQYELNYTGVLNILDLAGIPLRASQRDEEYPLVIGGGPCALNPEPLAHFFDLFVLGDGEEAVPEVCRAVMASKEKGEKKAVLLERLAGIEGVYIPSFFDPEYAGDGRLRRILPLKPGYSHVTRRVLADLDKGPFPSRPVLPFMEVIHDRLNLEIARGCTRGCRFCQAGMIYRPLRERSPRRILEIAKTGLESTGHDEVSLLSLSTGDYSCIEPLLSSILDHTRGGRIAVSLPSLRVETLTPALIQRILEVRKTGFTLAPEAGTERLRRVINKGNTQEDLLSTLERVFSAGWRSIKLYFMIGLPTEEEKDLEGIAHLCREALNLARRSRASAQINVSVSTFIPKAHTPFQWEAQSFPEEVERKQRFLRRSLDRRGLEFKWADPRVSLLEGIFARGDRKLSGLLEAAYFLGCRLDGWGEHFRYDLWEKALSQSGLNPSFYLRARDLEEILPWDHLHSRVSKSFLRQEREKALANLCTADCRQASCNGCGVCYGVDGLSNRCAEWERGSELSSPPPKKTHPSLPVRRFRARLTKAGPARFLGHLDFSRGIIRAFRRAGVPLAFSQGFHPLPKIAFGPPLPVGYESWAEYLDFQVWGDFLPEKALLRLNEALFPGVEFLALEEIPLPFPSIFDNISSILYGLSFPGGLNTDADRLAQFGKADAFRVSWARKKKDIDLKKVVESLTQVDSVTIQIRMIPSPEGALRPEEALGYIIGWAEGQKPRFAVKKIQVCFKDPQPCPTRS
ncbi:MAG: TIGR03960 family B12-binding radical SAM protein [Syntrophaceae bacterium]|nr:TIGR03960 family B12-binding radical SAM protein [Syntrophaceae bacterium]